MSHSSNNYRSIRLTTKHFYISLFYALIQQPCSCLSILLGYCLIILRWASSHNYWKTKSIIIVTTVITGVRMILPISVFYFLYHTFRCFIHDILQFNTLTLLLFIYSLIEIVFYFVIWYHSISLQLLHTPPNYSQQQRYLYIYRCIHSCYTLPDLSDPTNPSDWFHPCRFFSGWFYGVSYNDIYRENIIEFFCATKCNNQEYKSLTTEEHIHYNNLVTYFEYTLAQRKQALKMKYGHLSQYAAYFNTPNTPIRDGYNHKINAIKLCTDKVTYTHRPLALYAILSCCHVLNASILRYRGFKRYQNKYISYWYRDALIKKDEPLIFIHGIGLAIFPYLHYLPSITDTRAAYLLELPSISMQLSSTVINSEKMISGIQTMLRSHNDTAGIFCGHSYGTFIISWIVKNAPHLVSKVVLIDPVNFCIADHYLAYNFLYKRPNTGMHIFLKFIASNELHINYTLKRHFWWYENILWLQDLSIIQHQINERHKNGNLVTSSKEQHNKVPLLPDYPTKPSYCAHVFLSESDDIINAKHIYSYLTREESNFDAELAEHPHIDPRVATKPSISVTMFQKFKHAQFLVSAKSWKVIQECF